MVGWMTAMAFASPGAAGALHLGALPFPGGTGYAGGGGAFAWVAGGGVGGIPVVEGGVGLSDRVALTALVATVAPSAPAVPALISGRYLVVNEPDVRFAVTGNLSLFPFVDGSPVEVHLSPGLALDAGGERVRFDAAVPLWGLSSIGRYAGIDQFPVPLVSTFGVDFRLTDQQRLRFGLPELLSWHYRGERMYADLGGLTVLVAGVVWGKVGVVF